MIDGEQAAFQNKTAALEIALGGEGSFTDFPCPVPKCARCGQPHPDMIAKPLTRGIGRPAAIMEPGTHYGICPATGQPIFLAIRVNLTKPERVREGHEASYALKIGYRAKQGYFIMSNDALRERTGMDRAEMLRLADFLTRLAADAEHKIDPSWELPVWVGE